MSDQYGKEWKKEPCPVCGKEITINGLGRDSHMRTHEPKYTSIFLRHVTGGRYKHVSFLEDKNGILVRAESNDITLSFEDAMKLKSWIEEVLANQEPVFPQTKKGRVQDE